MPYEMVKDIAKQVPAGIVVHFHNNGEPTLYPGLGDALSLFKHCIRGFNTNGKLLLEKDDEIIGNLETLTISVIQDDPEGEEQYEIVRKFIERKGIRKPILVFRLLGNVEASRWEKLPGIVCRRILHAPEGSFNYAKTPTIPEIGICLDLLTHLAIDRYGLVSVCVRFDPKREGVIGNVSLATLEEIWNGDLRKHFLDCHIKGHREYLRLCSKCDYWGIATSP